MSDIVVGKGKLTGKGTYAGRDFKKGERVMSWKLEELSQAQFDSLHKEEQIFVHSFWGRMYRFSEPACYTNHSAHANTVADYEDMCDYAVRPIKQGEMITTNATSEFKFEVRTFLEVYEGTHIKNFDWLRGGYRNATVRYTIKEKAKLLRLKRKNGNWNIISEHLSSTWDI